MLLFRMDILCSQHRGGHVEDVTHISVEQFYQRRLIDNRMSYRPANMYMLEVRFFHDREPRQERFSLNVQQRTLPSVDAFPVVTPKGAEARVVDYEQGEKTSIHFPSLNEGTPW